MSEEARFNLRECSIIREHIGPPLTFIQIDNPSKDDIEYARRISSDIDNIEQSDLRDGMQIIEISEEGTHTILRSAKLEREYQAWQEEVRRKSDENNDRH